MIWDLKFIVPIRGKKSRPICRKNVAHINEHECLCQLLVAFCNRSPVYDGVGKCTSESPRSSIYRMLAGLK